MTESSSSRSGDKLRREGPSEAGAPAAERPDRPTTLRDIAAAVELSTATVSLVLNQSPAADAIPTATQERVRAAAQKLNYRPNLLARSLRQQRSTTIGVLVPDISSYSVEVMTGVEDCLVDARYAYFLASHRSRDDLQRHYLNLFEDHQVEGFLLIGIVLAEAPTLPTVMVSGRPEPTGVPHVVVDHDVAARAALLHVRELGHERIAFFRGTPDSVDSADRWRADREAAVKLGIELEDKRVLQLGGSDPHAPASLEGSYEEGYAQGQRLLENDPTVTALLGFNDVSAIGAMRAFLDAGLDVPRDISVIGFDDIESAAFHNPSLTTIRQPLHEMGVLATNHLLRLLAGETIADEALSVEPELIVRGSTGPAPRSG